MDRNISKGQLDVLISLRVARLLNYLNHFKSFELNASTIANDLLPVTNLIVIQISHSQVSNQWPDNESSVNTQNLPISYLAGAGAISSSRLSKFNVKMRIYGISQSSIDNLKI